MFKSIAVKSIGFGLSLKPNLINYNYRPIHTSVHLWIGRIDVINSKDRDLTEVKRSVCKQELEKHFCRQIETHFGFNSDQSRQLSTYCCKAFDSDLNSGPLIDRCVRLVAKHFPPNDVFSNPQIFAINYITLTNRLAILNELSLKRFPIVSIESCFPTLLQKSVKEVKTMGLCESECNVITHLVSSSECEPQFREQLVGLLAGEEVQSMSLESIRNTLIAKYISLRFKLAFDESMKIVKKKNSRIYLRPLATIVANCRLLLDECKMPANRLLKNTYLLTANTENVRKIVDRIDRIGGQPLMKVCIKQPKLLDTKYETLVNNLNILTKHFTDDQISNNVPVLELSTKLLSERVELLTQNPDLKPFLHNKRVLRIVNRMNRALNRLDCLKSSDFRLITIDYLTGNTEYFETVVLRNGGEWGEGMGAINMFAQTYLNTDLCAMRSTLGKHPKERRFNLRNAMKIYEFLIASDVTKEQLINGLFIVLYDFGFVKNKFEILFNTYDHKKWKSNKYLIQLLIYSIEKDFGHKGDGVYATMD